MRESEIKGRERSLEKNGPNFDGGRAYVLIDMGLLHKNIVYRMNSSSCVRCHIPKLVGYGDTKAFNSQIKGLSECTELTKRRVKIEGSGSSGFECTTPFHCHRLHLFRPAASRPCFHLGSLVTFKLKSLLEPKGD